MSFSLQFLMWALGCVVTGLVTTLVMRGINHIKNKLFKKS